MITSLKYSLVRLIEKFPSIHTIIYNNIDKFYFLFPHEKDFYGLRDIFNRNHKGDFLDVGGNIGLSTIGFRSLGFVKNRIFIFEPNMKYCNDKLKLLKKNYKKIKIFPFGLSSKNKKLKLFTPIFNGKVFHFLSSSDKKYVIKKLQYHYQSKSKLFKLYKNKIFLKKYDDLKLKIKPTFIKIDVEGHDHEVILGMKKSIKKFNPVILIEYNPENFKNIYIQLKKSYKCYIFSIFQNKLINLSKKEMKQLLKGSNKSNFFLSNRNIYFMPNKWKSY